MAGATWNCCRLGASSVYTIQPCTSLKCHFIRSHLRRMHVSVTCNPHFCQNDLDLLRATAVTRGRNGYRNKSQHRKLTLEKKFSRRSCRDSNPGPFNHESDALTTELSPLPTESQLKGTCPRALKVHFQRSPGLLNRRPTQISHCKGVKQLVHRTASSIAAKEWFFEKPGSRFVR